MFLYVELGASHCSLLQQPPSFRFARFLLASPCIGGRSGIENSQVVSAFLKLSMDGFLVMEAGILFHSMGPLTANDASYCEENFLFASLWILGTLARIPRRSLLVNSIPRSFGEIWWRILNIMTIEYLSLRL